MPLGRSGLEKAREIMLASKQRARRESMAILNVIVWNQDLDNCHIEGWMDLDIRAAVCGIKINPPCQVHGFDIYISYPEREAEERAISW